MQCDCDSVESICCASDSICTNRALKLECNKKTCTAGDNCQNRRFMNRNYCDLILFLTNNRGWGIKASTNINKGTFIIEYVGEIIDKSEYKRRLQCANFTNNYIIKVDNHLMIDAEVKGNLARFLSLYCFV